MPETLNYITVYPQYLFLISSISSISSIFIFNIFNILFFIVFIEEIVSSISKKFIIPFRNLIYKRNALGL